MDVKKGKTNIRDISLRIQRMHLYICTYRHKDVWVDVSEFYSSYTHAELKIYTKLRCWNAANAGILDRLGKARTC